MAPWLRYLLAAIVLVHGMVYAGIGAVLPAPIKVWQGHSWLLGSAVTGDQLRGLAVTLHVAAGLVFLGCAFAIMLASSYPNVWPWLAFAGAVLGTAAFAVFWDGRSNALVAEGVLGVLVNLALIAAAVVAVMRQP